MIKLYSYNHASKTLKKYSGSTISASLRHKISKMEFTEELKSRDEYVRHFLKLDKNKFDAVSVLIDFINVNSIKSIVSLGSGSGLLEFILCQLNHNLTVTAMDFDSALTQAANSYFSPNSSSNLKYLELDMRDFDAIAPTIANADLIVSFGALYIYDDLEYKRLLSVLKNHNVRYLVDFHAGCLSSFGMVRTQIKNMLSVIINRHKLGIHHGFGRTDNQIRRIYDQSDYNIIQSASLTSYRKYYVLERNAIV